MITTDSVPTKLKKFILVFLLSFLIFIVLFIIGIIVHPVFLYSSVLVPLSAGIIMFITIHDSVWGRLSYAFLMSLIWVITLIVIITTVIDGLPGGSFQ